MYHDSIGAADTHRRPWLTSAAVAAALLGAVAMLSACGDSSEVGRSQAAAVTAEEAAHLAADACAAVDGSGAADETGDFAEAFEITHARRVEASEMAAKAAEGDEKFRPLVEVYDRWVQASDRAREAAQGGEGDLGDAVADSAHLMAETRTECERLGLATQ